VLAGAYAAARDRLCPEPSVDRFFVSVTGRALRRGEADRVFREITGLIGLRTDAAHPRIHDMRHAFAVHTLIDGHRDGADISALLPVLSTYLGHYSEVAVMPNWTSVRLVVAAQRGTGR